jgi:septum formation protein
LKTVGNQDSGDRRNDIITFVETIKSIILASKSPRRKDLLKKAGIKFKIVESKFDEQIDPKLNPKEQVKKLSLEKAKAVYDRFKKSIIIAADTLVVCEGIILEKPKDKEDARKMLEFLSGKIHSLITGFTIIDGETIVTKSEETKITMRGISKHEIDNYIMTKEPFDKAGGYAIQGEAAKFITKIDGDLSNAVGLPIDSLLRELKKLGAF